MPFAVRPRLEWRLRRRILSLGPRTLIMGVLNVTPDSFSDGGQFLSSGAGLAQALKMLDQGADILDLGGESTRPSSTHIAPAEEQARVLPVLRAILSARPEAVVSIDTYHAETARLAVEAGAEIVNDVSGHLWDSAMAATCAQLGCGAILMHTRGRPWQWRTQPPLAPDEVVPLVLGDLRERAQAAVAAGIARDSIVLDPGFGFGKIGDENYPLLARFDALHALGYALLAGVSRKSFLTRTPGFRPTANPGAPSQTALSSEVGILGAPHLAFDTREPGAPHLASEMWELGRELPTTVANTAAILAGAHILRVHDVPPALQAAAIADRVLAAIA